MRLPSLGTPLPRTTAWRETSGFQFPKGGRRSSRSWRALTVHLLIPRRDSGNRHLARHGGVLFVLNPDLGWRSEEHTSELQSLMRISYAVFCLKKKNNKNRLRETKTD